MLCGDPFDLDTEQLAALCQRLAELDAAAEAELRALLATIGAPMQPADPLAAALRVALGQDRPGEAAWLTHAILTTILSGGAIPLDRAIRVPTTQTGWARLRRDMWLRAAAAHVGGTCLRERARLLSSAAARFMSVRWPALRNHRDPPSNLAPLEASLFLAARVAGDRVRVDLEWRQIVNVLRDAPALPSRSASCAID